MSRRLSLLVGDVAGAKARTKQREGLQACVAHAQEAGRKYISVASYVLAGEK